MQVQNDDKPVEQTRKNIQEKSVEFVQNLGGTTYAGIVSPLFGQHLVYKRHRN
jgi:hypothetical protein